MRTGETFERLVAYLSEGEVVRVILFMLTLW